MSEQKAVLAFSGGLDTTWCAVWLREQGHEVHTVTVQTGGFDRDELARIEHTAKAAGAVEHHTLDARARLFDDTLRYLIFANALRGDVYPLSVSAERAIQARLCAEHARTIDARYLVHGSTGAGNDQVRFDVAFRVFAPGVEILAPIRELALTRDQEVAWLAERGVQVPAKTGRYSVNRGLWGTTIGGGETHSSDGELPEDAWVITAPRQHWPAQPQEVAIQFDRGIPTALDGRPLDPVTLIESLNETAGRHGVGRGVHLGDTILGIKGRVAFEAPAALVLIAAHRELEKLVLSRHQQLWKATLGDLYGSFLHEARFLDPLMRDIEAFLASSQQRVSGRARVRLHQGQATVLGVTSPFSALDAARARYGESTGLWNGAEAAAFSKLYGLQDWLLYQAASHTAAGQEGGDHAALH